jgi:hypothetical protein
LRSEAAESFGKPQVAPPKKVKTHAQLRKSG